MKTDPGSVNAHHREQIVTEGEASADPGSVRRVYYAHGVEGWRGAYGVESKLMLLAWVEEADLWLEKTWPGEAWMMWSTRCPTEDGRIRVPSCANMEFLL